MDLKGRDFIALEDWSKEEIEYLLNFAAEIKADFKAGKEFKPLKGKSLGMIFQKNSTRTRVSFEIGMYQLGGHPMFLSASDTQLGRGEPIKDTARVLSGYIDGIMIRTFSHSDVEELAEYASIPVINGLTDLLHPCQVMADLMTIQENFGKGLKGRKLVYLGDGNNVAHSLMIGCTKMGMDVVVAAPPQYNPLEEYVGKAKVLAKESGGSFVLTDDVRYAVQDADVLYTDTWVSMGQEEEKAEKVKKFSPFQVNDALLKIAKSSAIVMHCLPAYRGFELTDEVMEGKQSVVFQESENRLHAQKAILAALL